MVPLCLSFSLIFFSGISAQSWGFEGDGAEEAVAEFKLVCAVSPPSRAPASCPTKRSLQGWCLVEWEGIVCPSHGGDVRLQEYDKEQGCLQAQVDGEITECETQGHGVACWKMLILSPG